MKKNIKKLLILQKHLPDLTPIDRTEKRLEAFHWSYSLSPPPPLFSLYTVGLVFETKKRFFRDLQETQLLSKSVKIH